MVVTFQNGDCRSFGHAMAGIVVNDIPDKAKPKTNKDGFMRQTTKNIKNDPNYIVYKVYVGNFTGGYYTGKDQAQGILKQFNQAMDQGEKAFNFPADNPQRRGIFK